MWRRHERVVATADDLQQRPVATVYDGAATPNGGLDAHDNVMEARYDSAKAQGDDVEAQGNGAETRNDVYGWRPMVAGTVVTLFLLFSGVLWSSGQEATRGVSGQSVALKGCCIVVGSGAQWVGLVRQIVRGGEEGRREGIALSPKTPCFSSLQALCRKQHVYGGVQAMTVSGAAPCGEATVYVPTGDGATPCRGAWRITTLDPCLGESPRQWRGGLEHGYLIGINTEGRDEDCLHHDALGIREGSIVRTQI
ncbi:hypothetical protein GUJ93_ZPchr0001g32425 [Zizania palustris]|uniref:Uncharacterized protein n=1 Tax=Zizania palustris TaxID=103762 RepID=A0A8J5V9S9_ZIZPA|nr:hypothetical protein GUJ93_ZPchr0001g32425 [Zizania palustris]